MTSALAYLECSACGERYDADTVQQLCTDGKPLLARYELRAAAATLTRELLSGREASLWRYGELLPLRDPARRVSLGESMTPILSLPRSSARYGVELLLKDEALLPTGSFKARGAAVAVSRARELGIREFALPTNGNAGGAWAAYGARAGMHAHVVMPRGAPRVNRLETIMTGADVSLVDGTIADAGKIVAQGVREHGWFDASTLKEPYRIEGKKTIGFELAEQLGWSVPDVIVYPTGGGVGLIGIDKALREFAEIAFGINVPKPLGDALILRALRDTKGTAIAVDDAEILAKQRELSMDEGIFVCPEGGATLAAVAALRVSGWIAPAERVLLINTGAGVKYPDIPYEDLE